MQLEQFSTAILTNFLHLATRTFHPNLNCRFQPISNCNVDLIALTSLIFSLEVIHSISIHDMHHKRERKENANVNSTHGVLLQQARISLLHRCEKNNYKKICLARHMSVETGRLETWPVI